MTEELLNVHCRVTHINRHSGTQEHLQQLECVSCNDPELRWIQDVAVHAPEDYYAVNDEVRVVLGLNEAYQEQYRYQADQTPYSSAVPGAFPDGLDSIHLGTIEQVTSSSTHIQITLSAGGLSTCLELPYTETHKSLLTHLYPEARVYLGMQRI